MFRFVAIGWNASNECADNVAHELIHEACVKCSTEEARWISACSRPGLCVFYTGPRERSLAATSLLNGQLVILGTVFERYEPSAQEAPRRKSFSVSEAREIIRSKGETLPSICWGRYVAFLQGDSSDAHMVVRDPTGGLPCYVISHRGVQIYFSRLEDCLPFPGLSLSINWPYIAARSAYVFVNSRQTAVDGVTQVLPGERIEYSREMISKSFVWDPLRLALEDPIDHAPTAASKMRHAARSSIHAWASCYDGILHRLSGGLDSSIVAGCLRDAPTRPRVTCLNYYSAGCDGDEREYARVVASYTNHALVERERESKAKLVDMLNIDLWPTPTMYLAYLQASRSEASLAKEIGAGAIFGGGGGDQLFYQARAILAAPDYMYMHGFDSRFLQVVMDVAFLARRSVWHVFAETARRMMKGYSWDDRAIGVSHREMLSDEIRENIRTIDNFKHPLFDGLTQFPPGKAWHIFGLTFPQEFYDPLGAPGDPEHVEPLISQPLLEVALRIPSYVMVTGGWDRAIARRAFNGDVPTRILARRTKGGMDENAQALLMRDIDTARDLLIDGYLVRQRCLDRARTEAALADRPTTVTSGIAEIFDHLSTEVWLRRFHSLTGQHKESTSHFLFGGRSPPATVSTDATI